MSETVEIKSNGVSITMPLNKWYSMIKEHSQVNSIKTAIGLNNLTATSRVKGKRTIWTSQMVETLKAGLNTNKNGAEIARELNIPSDKVYNKIASLKNSNSV